VPPQTPREKIDAANRALLTDIGLAWQEYTWRENREHWTDNNRSWSVVSAESPSGEDFATIEARFVWQGNQDEWSECGKWVWRVWRGREARYTDAVYLNYIKRKIGAPE